jgi:hypothetical protein
MKTCGLELEETWYKVELSVLFGRDGVADIGPCVLTDPNGHKYYPDTRRFDFQNLFNVKSANNITSYRIPSQLWRPVKMSELLEEIIRCPKCYQIQIWRYKLDFEAASYLCGFKDCGKTLTHAEGVNAADRWKNLQRKDSSVVNK